ncbi:MAG TPA: DUF11 domain-containing protein, partial [Acidimicrobiales bacterium]
DATVVFTDVAPTLTVDKSANPTSVPATGGNVTYTVVVTNTSFEPVTLTSLVDDKFGNLNGQGTCATGGTIAANGGTYTCTFTKALAQTADHTNIVTATVTDDDNTSASANDNAVVTFDPRADLGVVKDVDLAEIGVSVEAPNPTVTFTIKVTNYGPSPAVNAVVTDTLPAELSDVVITKVEGPAETPTYVCGAVAGGTFTCTLANHAVGDTHTITVTAKVNVSIDDLRAGKVIPITNAASVTSATIDQDDSNNRDDATTTPGLVSAPADMAIVKTASVAGIVPGQAFSYTLTVTNNGPDQAPNVVVTDTVPAKLTLNSVTSAQMSCSNVGNAITCTKALMLPAETATVTVNVTAAGSGFTNGELVVNTGVVSSGQEDTDPNNNTSTVRTPVQVIVLPPTGADPGRALQLASLALVAGFLLVLVSRKREDPLEA